MEHASEFLREYLYVRLISARFVPRLLTDEQKHRLLPAANTMAMLKHPPYSLVLAPCGSFLLQRRKSQLQGLRFQAVPEIQE
jgi:hypothetical protein